MINNNNNNVGLNDQNNEELELKPLEEIIEEEDNNEILIENEHLNKENTNVDQAKPIKSQRKRRKRTQFESFLDFRKTFNKGEEKSVEETNDKKEETSSEEKASTETINIEKPTEEEIKDSVDNKESKIEESPTLTKRKRGRPLTQAGILRLKKEEQKRIFKKVAEETTEKVLPSSVNEVFYEAMNNWESDLDSSPIEETESSELEKEVETQYANVEENSELVEEPLNEESEIFDDLVEVPEENIEVEVSEEDIEKVGNGATEELTSNKKASPLQKFFNLFKRKSDSGEETDQKLETKNKVSTSKIKEEAKSDKMPSTLDESTNNIEGKVIDLSESSLEIEHANVLKDLSKKIDSEEKRKKLLKSNHEVTLENFATLVYKSDDNTPELSVSENNEDSNKEALILEEDTTAAIGLPKLENIIEDINETPKEEATETFEFPYVKEEKSEITVDSNKDEAPIDEILENIKVEVEEVSSVPEIEPFDTYSSTQLLDELEAGRYQELIEETSTKTEEPVVAQEEKQKFIVPNRNRRRKRRSPNTENLEDVQQEIAKTIPEETTPNLTQRKKNTRRHLKRQENLKQEQAQDRAREITNNLNKVETEEGQLIFTKVEPNILKGGITLFNNLARQMQSNGALRVESLMSVLGSLAGYSTQAAAREKLVKRLRLSEEQIFSIVETADGSKYYFGDSIDRSLQKDKHSLWYMTATATYNLTGKVDSNIDEIIRYSTRNMGKPNYGIPRISKSLKPSHYPRYYVEHMWSALVPGLERFSDDPMDWPLIFGVALQRALICTRSVLDPNVSLRIILESAVPMAFSAVYPIELSVAKSKKDAEAKLINELTIEISIIRKTLEDENLSDEQKVALYKELTDKNERLMILLSK